MKKFWIVPAALVVFAGTVAAQSGAAFVKNDKKLLNAEEKNIRKEKQADRQELRAIQSNVLNEETRQHFYQDFGDVSGVIWSREGNFDKVTFLQNKKTLSAYYNANSELVGTTSAKTFADLPERAQKLINKKYPGYETVAVTFFDDNETNNADMMMYGQRFPDDDSYFIELLKGNKKLILQANKAGDIGLFKTL